MLPRRSTTRARGLPEARPAIGSHTTSSLFFAPALAIDGCDARAIHRDDAEHLVRAGAQTLDNARFIAVIGFLQTREHALAAAERRTGVVAARHNDDLRRLFVGFPTLWLREQFAVHVLAGNFENGDFGNCAGLFIAALARACDRAFFGEFAQDALQCDAVGAFD